MVSYKAQFEGLSNRLKGLLKRHKLNYFLSGLKDEILLLVRMLNPINLCASFGLVKIQEEYMLTSRKAMRQYSGSVEKGSIDSSVDGGSKVLRSNARTKRIFSSHMDEKRKKCLCYHCDEKWNPSHVCKSPKVCLLHVDDSMEGMGDQGEYVEVVQDCVLEQDCGSEDLKSMQSLVSLVIML